MNRDIFKKRVNLKPYEYPELLEYKDSMRHSYWISDEFNYTADIQDFKTNIDEVEKSAITRAMLAISQIEVSVKRFWSDIYHYMPKPEIDMVGVTFGECHAEGTEALTPKGWVDFRELNAGDIICQFNPNDQSCEFVPAISITKQPYIGPMYRFSKRKWICEVTPNHGMLDYDKNGKVRVRLAKDYYSDTSATKPFAALLEGPVGELSMMDRLKIAIQADGHMRFYRNDKGEKIHRGLNSGCWTYDISLKKERKIDRLVYILQNVNVTYRMYVDGRGYTRFEIDMPQEDYKNFDWVDLSDKNKYWCNEFINELSCWDGYLLYDKKDCFRKYSTTSKSCADKVQAIGTMAGYWTTINHYIDNRSPNFKDIYTVSFVDNRYRVHHNCKKEEFLYRGMVYCAKVPSGFLITRYKGTVSIEHNSEARHLDAYANLLELLGLNEMFEKLHEYKPLMARVEYMEKFMRGKNEGEKGFILSMILFSLFVEHISLFSQFVLIMSFNKHRNLFKGMSNAIEATSKEEELHGKFGIALYNIVKEEHPEIFTTEFYQELHQLASDAFTAEMDIIDWIYENGDIPFISKNTIINYIKHRYNNSFVSLGQERIYDVDETLLKEVSWFDEELISTKEVDFFNKRSIDYSKRGKAITADDLF